MLTGYDRGSTTRTGASAQMAALGGSSVVSPAPPGARSAIRVRHNLRNDPRLERSAIAELASTAKPSSIEHHVAALPLLLPTGEAPQLELTPPQVVRGIEDNNCWIGLFHLEQEDRYRRLLDDCLASWKTHFALEGGMTSTTASVYLASPYSVTPAHIDRPHNLLLQIEGTKEVVVGTFDTREDEAAEVNRHFDPEPSNFSTLPPHSTSWVIGPGEGLYLPPYTPHWVRTGNEVTLSLSCVVRTPASRRLERAHICNARLRRMGLHPAPAGSSDLVDTAKATIVSAGRWARESSVTKVARRTLKMFADSSHSGALQGALPASGADGASTEPDQGG